MRVVAIALVLLLAAVNLLAAVWFPVNTVWMLISGAGYSAAGVAIVGFRGLKVSIKLLIAGVAFIPHIVVAMHMSAAMTFGDHVVKFCFLIIPLLFWILNDRKVDKNLFN